MNTYATAKVTPIGGGREQRLADAFRRLVGQRITGIGYIERDFEAEIDGGLAIDTVDAEGQARRLVVAYCDFGMDVMWEGVQGVENPDDLLRYRLRAELHKLDVVGASPGNLREWRRKLEPKLVPADRKLLLAFVQGLKGQWPKKTEAFYSMVNTYVYGF